MPINPYGLCPCGSGKKVKFCCADLMGEMEKIQRMLDGEQRVACLAHVTGLLALHPNRASLLGLKAMLETQLGQFDHARQTVDTLLAVSPDSTTGLAEKAILLAQTEGGRAAVAPLQAALEHTTEAIGIRVYEAIGAVGQALLAEGEILAAQAHLHLQTGMSQGGDERAQALLLRLSTAPQVPLLLKEAPPLQLPPEDASWKGEFRQALEHAAMGQWRRAEQTFTQLVETSANHPAVWRNLAWLRLWLADQPGGIAALHKVGGLAGVSIDDATESEALAQLLDPAAREKGLEIVQRTIPIVSTEDFETALIGDAQTSRVPIDTSNWSTEQGPPPRSAYFVLDRPLPRTGVDLTLETAPLVLGDILVYGRETDREARVVLVATQGQQLEEATAVLKRFGGAALAATSEDEVIGHTSVLQQALSWRWRLPDDTPEAVREALTTKRQRAAILEDWPKLPLPVLEGRTPQEVAQDPAERIAVLASILLLELGSASDGFDFNELRSAIGLPIAGPIDPEASGNSFIPLVRLSRVMVEKLSDQRLLDDYIRAALFGANQAAHKLATEVIARESLNGKVDKSEAHGLLAKLESDPQRAIEHVIKARELAEAQGASSAPWDLIELSLLIEQGKAAEANAMLNHIRVHHMREPGVGEQLMEIMMQAGVIGPDGRPTGPMPAAGLSPTPAPSQSPGGLWTPDGAAPAAPASPGKSKLWMPGMD